MGQIAEQLQGHHKGKFLSQPKHAMAITIHQNSKGIDNGVEEDLVDNMPLHSKTKGEDIVEEKEEISVVPIPSKIDQEKDLLPLPSLYKAANSYKPPILPTCHP